MNFNTYRFVIIIILVISFEISIGQNISINPKKCFVSPSHICNPFVNGYLCISDVLRTTHGSPSFYAKDSSSIQLNAAISTNGTMYSEGFTLAYHFSKGKAYTVTIKHKGVPQTGAVIFPSLIVNLTNDPPRFDDACDLGRLSSINVITQSTLTISSTTTTSTAKFTPDQDIFFLWLRSSPIQFPEAGLLISSIEIVDHSIVIPPPTEPPARCIADFDFCGYDWNGNHIFRVNQPLNLSCNAFKTERDRGVNFGRRFVAHDITLSNGFIASATDYPENNPFFQAIAVSDPCRQAVRIAVNDTTKSIRRNTRFKNDDNTVLLYPSPSSGIVYISGDELLLKSAKITIVDQLGRVILQQTNNNTATPIKLNLQHVDNGLYFCQISVDNNTTVKKLIIKK